MCSECVGISVSTFWVVFEGFFKMCSKCVQTVFVSVLGRSGWFLKVWFQKMFKMCSNYVCINVRTFWVILEVFFPPKMCSKCVQNVFVSVLVRSGWFLIILLLQNVSKMCSNFVRISVRTFWVIFEGLISKSVQKVFKLCLYQC